MTSALAVPQALDPAAVFAHAPATVQVLAVLLGLASLTAIALSVLKLVQGPRRAGGSALLSDLRLAGPLLGLAGAGWSGLRLCLGLANARAGVTLQTLAPGAAEVLLLVVLGLGCGAIATLANWAVEGQLDRAVLR